MQGVVSLRLLFLIAFTVLTFFALSFVKPILWPFVLSIVLAYILEPITQYMTGVLGSRVRAGTLVVITLVFVFIGSISILLPVLMTQLLGVLEKLPQSVEMLFTTLQGWGVETTILEEAKKFMTADDGAYTWQGVAASGLGNGYKILLGQVSNVVNSAFLLALVPIILFYFTKDWDRICNICLNTVPHKYRLGTIECFNRIDIAVAGFLRGQITVMTILGVWYSVVLSIIGLDYAIGIGFVTGVIVFIPYVGAFIGFLLAFLIGLLQFGDVSHSLMILGTFAFAQTVESFILTPNIVGEKVGLHPVWIMIALMSGGVLFGFIGVLLAVPTAAAIGACVRFSYKKYTKSNFYNAL